MWASFDLFWSLDAIKMTESFRLSIIFNFLPLFLPSYSLFYFLTQVWPSSCIFFPSLAPWPFIVGGDTVISSGTWKRESQRRYYFNLCRIFTKKKKRQKSVSVENNFNFLAWDFSPFLHFFSSFFSASSEKPVELKCPMPLAFAIFVYWFSIYVYIDLFFITKHRWLEPFCT